MTGSSSTFSSTVRSDPDTQAGTAGFAGIRASGSSKSGFV